MRQRFVIILMFVLAVGILIAINSFAYVQEEDKQDSELAPNRSSYNAGATGTRSFYDLLNESGYKVTRWREPPEKLLGAGGEKVGTFVIIGRPTVTSFFCPVRGIGPSQQSLSITQVLASIRPTSNR